MTHAVIAAVDLDTKAAGIVLRAANLARLCNADLVVAHVVGNLGAEAGYAPFIGADDVQNAMLREAKGWLVGLLHHLGVCATEVAVKEGSTHEAVTALAVEHRACYVVTGQSKWGTFGRLAGLGREPAIEALRCEVLSVGAGFPAEDAHPRNMTRLLPRPA